MDEPESDLDALTEDVCANCGSDVLACPICGQCPECGCCELCCIGDDCPGCE